MWSLLPTFRKKPNLQDVRVWAPSFPECGGVGAVVLRSIYSWVILVL
jgi:hypothetical protein